MWFQRDCNEIITTVAQLFVANQNKPADIVNILVANRSKLLRLLADLKPDKGMEVLLSDHTLCIWFFSSLINALFRSILVAEDERFEADKSQVLREIAALEPQDLAWTNQPTEIILLSLFKHSKDIFGASKFVVVSFIR